MIYKLSTLEPIAHGGEKWIYQHPENPDLLIKVWRQLFFDVTRKRYPLATKFRRLPKYCALHNEITEHLAIREQKAETHHLQTIAGLVDTDRGPGLVVEAIRAPDGKLAPTPQQLIKTRHYTPRHQEALERLFHWMCNTDVIIRDFSLNNMVWDEANGHFVIIDGIGSKPVSSLRQYSKAYNKRSNRKKVEKLRSRLAEKLQKHKQPVQSTKATT